MSSATHSPHFPLYLTVQCPVVHTGQFIFYAITDVFKGKSASQCCQGLKERFYRYRTMQQIIRMWCRCTALWPQTECVTGAVRSDRKQNVVQVQCALTADTDNEMAKLAADTWCPLFKVISDFENGCNKNDYTCTNSVGAEICQRICLQDVPGENFGLETDYND